MFPMATKFTCKKKVGSNLDVVRHQPRTILMIIWGHQYEAYHQGSLLDLSLRYSKKKNSFTGKGYYQSSRVLVFFSIILWLYCTANSCQTIYMINIHIR